MLRHTLSMTLISVVCTFALGCATSPEPPGASAIVQGRAMAGPIRTGTVEANVIMSNGKTGKLLGTTTTDNDGNYSFSISDYSGPLLVKAVSGSFVDEASKLTVKVTASKPISAMSNIKPGNTTLVSITPLTQMAVERAKELMKTLPAGQAIKSANKQIAKLAGIRSNTNGNSLRMRFAVSDGSEEDDLDITKVIPNLPSETVADASAPEAQVTLFLAAISQMAETYEAAHPSTDGSELSSLDIMNSMASDFATDGALDGKDQGTTVNIEGSSAALPTSENAWTTQIETSQTDYIASPENDAGYVAADTITPDTSPPLEIPPDPTISEVPKVVAVASNNSGSNVYCSCNVPSLSLCMDFTGSYFETGCWSLGNSCAANGSGDGVLAQEACPAVSSGSGGSCSPMTDASFSGTTYYYLSPDSSDYTTNQTNCTNDAGTWTNL